jgi:hypothetical protein
MRGDRTIAKTWGTWATAEGERADGWSSERAGSERPAGADAVIAVSRHGLVGAGGGLAGVFAAARGDARLGSLL